MTAPDSDVYISPELCVTVLVYSGSNTKKVGEPVPY